MLTRASLSEKLRELLVERAEAAAIATGWQKRVRLLPGGVFVPLLVLGFLHKPAATLEELCRAGLKLVGVMPSKEAVAKRMNERAVAMLRQLLHWAVEEVLFARAGAVELVRRFRAVQVGDTTTVSLPTELASRWAGCGGRQGCTKAGVKLHVALDLLRGRLWGPYLSAARACDQRSPLKHLPVCGGSLSLYDLGFFALDSLRAVSERGGYWLRRLSGHVAVFDPQGRRLELGSWLASAEQIVVDRPVRLGVEHRLPARLLAYRVPPQVAAARRRRLRETARRKGRAPSERSLKRAGWTLLVSNAPNHKINPQEALVLLRIRWQIELLFKLWKSHLRIDKWRQKRPERVECQFYAKLLAVVVQHWCLLLGTWRFPQKSLFKAAERVRENASHLLLAIAGELSFKLVLKWLEEDLKHVPNVQKRKKKPNAFQLLQKPQSINFLIQELECAA